MEGQAAYSVTLETKTLYMAVGVKDGEVSGAMVDETGAYAIFDTMDHAIRSMDHAPTEDMHIAIVPVVVTTDDVTPVCILHRSPSGKVLTFVPVSVLDDERLMAGDKNDGE